MSVRDRGLAFGDGLFESFFCRPSHIPLLNDHLDRLRLGCRVIDLPYPEQVIRSSLDQAEVFLQQQSLSSNEAFKAKLVLTRGQGGGGYRPSDVQVQDVTVVLTVERFEREENQEDEGVRLAVSERFLSSNETLVGIKHLNRLDYILAAQSIRDPSYIPAVCDASGNIVESLHHNLFFVHANRLCTPKLERCGVEGIAKYWIKRNHNTGLPFVELNANIDLLAQASEVFICNSVRGVWPVSLIRCRGQLENWQPGSMTRHIQRALHAVLWQDGNRGQ